MGKKVRNNLGGEKSSFPPAKYLVCAFVVRGFYRATLQPGFQAGCSRGEEKELGMVWKNLCKICASPESFAHL
jgi:hypothetical protein